ncbi:MAG: hypothetical protein IJQ50_00235 [Clostridia bacterium]|nr:hypothetical protein [Clostridia bacterium]
MDKIEYDGEFTYNGEIIKFRITDNSYPIRKVKGTEKMSRYIHFYKSNGDNLGFTPIYGTVEEMTNLSPFDAHKWYEKMK